MVSPLFPSLTPRYIDEHWFNFEVPFEDETLAALEKDHRSLISEIENSDQDNTQGSVAVYSEAEEEEEDDADNNEEDDYDEESDNDDEFADDLFNIASTAN